MKITKLTVGELEENCYILEYNDKEAAVIDPGAEGEAIAARLDGSGLKLTHILLTHGHFDHIGAVQYLKERYGASVYISHEDECMLADREKSRAAKFPSYEFVPTSADVLLEDGQEIALGTEKLKVVATPGHTEGSVCFVGEGVIFAGDTVFKGSVGCIDLELRGMGDSLKKLKALDEDYILYCGHGEDTSLKHEKENNTYFKSV